MKLIHLCVFWVNSRAWQVAGFRYITAKERLTMRDKDSSMIQIKR
jgi:hypothetical protein